MFKSQYLIDNFNEINDLLSLLKKDINIENKYDFIFNILNNKVQRCFDYVNNNNNSLLDLNKENKIELKEQKKETWAEMMEKSDNESKSNIIIDKKLKEHENKLLFLKNNLKLDKKSYTLKFEFLTSIIIWTVNDQYMEGNYFKFSLNPIRDNEEIFQYFYYDYNNSLIGVSGKNEIRWFKLDYNFKTMIYYDNRNNPIYFTCSMIDIEEPIKITNRSLIK